jgi:hypothetical protein
MDYVAQTLVNMRLQALEKAANRVQGINVDNSGPY